MGSRSLLPDTFYVNGYLLTLPVEDGETIVRWLERIGLILEYIDSDDNDGSEASLERAKEASRIYLDQVVLGVTYE